MIYIHKSFTCETSAKFFMQNYMHDYPPAKYGTQLNMNEVIGKNHETFLVVGSRYESECL